MRSKNSAINRKSKRKNRRLKQRQTLQFQRLEPRQLLAGDILISDPSSSMTSEAGGDSTFTVVLGNQPTDDVLINVVSSDPDEGLVSTPPVIFTPDNWSQPQTVIVSGVDDQVVELPQTYEISFTATSSDNNYNDLPIPDVISLTNIDDDSPGWAFALNSEDSVYIWDIASGPSDNIYMSGEFDGTVDFDPGPGAYSLTAQDTAQGDGFIAKYDSAGDLLWVQTFGGIDGYEGSSDIDFDSAGNVLLIGESNAATISVGSTSITNQGGTHSFLTKIDASGNFQWVRSWGGSSTSSSSALAKGIAVAADDSIHVAGYFYETADFDPGAGTYQLTSADTSDAYLLNLDSNGNFVSVLAITGTSQDWIEEVDTDNHGDVYLAGQFDETSQFGTSDGIPVVLTSANGTADTFLMKVSLDGGQINTEWVRQVAGTDSNSSARLGVDGDGGVYLTTFFKGTIDIDSANPGTQTITSTGNYDSLISKWDNDGNLDWHGQITGTESNRLDDIQFDDDQNAYLVGRIEGTTDFNIGAQSRQLTSVVYRDTFMLKLGSGGSIEHVAQIAQQDRSFNRSIAVDNGGNVYLAADFRENIAFPTGDFLESTEGGSRNSYLLKLNFAPGISVSPTTGLVTTEDGGNASFDIMLDTQPTDDVTIGLASSDTSEGAVSTASLVFTPENWNVAQTVIVTGIDDNTVDGDAVYNIITSSATSSDPDYNGFNPADVSFTNLDDDQPLSLFADSFEVSEWNGLWVEDSQNDWRRQTQRATDGSWSAEVDGRATNATLTTANSIDLSNMQSATLTFDWLIERGYDTNEFLSLDISTNGGSTWQNDMRRLSGNVDSENTWHTETVDLSGYQTNELKFRFRSTVSRSSEDANIDNISVVGIPAGSPNEAPVADNDTYNMLEDGSLNIAAKGVLGNDTDPEDDPITARLISGPTDGSLTLNADGSFDYTPNADFNGSDSFTYVANDGTADSNVATVLISINDVNDSPVATDDTYVVDEDGTKVVLAPGVLGNDTDVDGDSLTVSLVGGLGPSNGSLTLGSDGSLSYSPAPNFSGIDSFDYQISDGNGGADTATVSIIVTGVNDTPTTSGISDVVVNEDALATNIGLFDAFEDIDDPDGDLIYNITANSNPNLFSNTSIAAGTLTLNYAADENGSSSITIRATDTGGMFVETTFSVTVNPVNDAPVAVDDDYITDQENPLTVVAPGVLGNDGDIDGDSLIVVNASVSDPTNGSVSLNLDGSFTYTPANGFYGSDSFTYVASDGVLDSDTATVHINVNRINNLPVAVNDAYSIDEDTSLIVGAPGILSNDTDDDGDPLIAVLDSGPSNGAVTLNSDGSFSYTPNANFHGDDSFTYVANDGTDNSNKATVNITIDSVNDVPIAVGNSYSIGQDTTLNVAAPGILNNDSDADGDSLTAIWASDPAHGSVSINADGSFDYSPDSGYFGTDSFTYVANDGSVDSTEAIVSISVNEVVVATGPQLAYGVVNGVGNSWVTVSLPYTYASMVVVASANYDDSTGPTVVRIRNADSGNSFEVLVQAAGGSAPTNLDVHYTVIEEGVYDAAGYKLEAVKFNSTVTDENNSWVGQSRSYGQSYTAPVVVGQVMTYNDSDWSNFWTRGSSRTSIPSASTLYVGKMVGEDADNTRADETIGYFVIETSNDGEIEGLPFRAGVGGDTVKGVDDAPAYQYSYDPFTAGIPKAAVVSMAGMDGGNGGWAMLYGSNPLPTASGGGNLYLAVDEDQSKDTERKHTTEQVAYFIIDPPVEPSVAKLSIDPPAPDNDLSREVQPAMNWTNLARVGLLQHFDSSKFNQQDRQPNLDWRKSLSNNQMPAMEGATQLPVSADEFFEERSSMWLYRRDAENETFDSNFDQSDKLDAAKLDDLFGSDIVDWMS